MNTFTNKCSILALMLIIFTQGVYAQITITSPTGICSDDTTTPLTLTATLTTPGSIANPIFRWYNEPTGGTLLRTGATYTPSPRPTSNQFYYVSVSSGAGGTESERVEASVLIRRPVSAGSVSITQSALRADTTVCAGQTVRAIGYSHETGADAWIWEYSTNGTNFTIVPGTWDLWECTTPALTETTYIRRTTVSICGTTYSNVITVNVGPPTAGAIGGAQSITSGTVASTLTSTTAASGGGPITYQWQSSSSGTSTSWTNIAGATNATYAPGVLTTTTYYRRGATNVCGTVYTSSVLKTVTSSADAISISGSTSICRSTTTTLTASASSVTSPVFRWYSASTGGTALRTGASYTTPSLTSNTTYYVSVAAGAAGPESNTRRAVTVTVAAAFNAGAISNTSTLINSGETPAAFTSTSSASGGLGTTTYRWQSSPDGTNWTDISGSSATSTTYAPGALTATTHYRRGATNSCGTVYTSGVTITVSIAASAISVSGSTSICNNTTTTLTASTSLITNPYFRWYTSSTGGTAFSSGASYTTPSLTSTTIYHISVSSGQGGTESVRRAVIVTVAAALDAGAINNTSTSIASGATPNAFTSTTAASGGSGTITYQWQSSPNGTSTSWTNISGATSITYAPGTLNATTHYRRAATNTCGTVYTASRQITVTSSADMIIVTGSNDSSVCSGTPATLNATASGVTNPEFKWYAAATGGSALHTGATFTPSPTTTTTYYVSVSGTSQSESSRKAVVVTVRPVATPDMIKITQ